MWLQDQHFWFSPPAPNHLFHSLPSLRAKFDILVTLVGQASSDHGPDDTLELSRQPVCGERKPNRARLATRPAACRDSDAPSHHPSSTHDRWRAKPRVPSSLPKFKGKRDEDVRQWLFQVETLCRIHGPNATDNNETMPAIPGTAMEEPASE